MSHKINRREFLRSTALAGASFWAAPTIWAEMKSPNEKLNIAGVGAGGQAGGDIGNVSSENIFAQACRSANHLYYRLINLPALRLNQPNRFLNRHFLVTFT